MLANRNIRQPIHGVKFNVAVIGITPLIMVMVGHFKISVVPEKKAGETPSNRTLGILTHVFCARQYLFAVAGFDPFQKATLMAN
jgi:hypothetical protein